jgi:transposase
LLAQVLFDKYRTHLPLNRQSDIYAKQGIDLDVSTNARLSPTVIGAKLQSLCAKFLPNCAKLI